MARGRNSRSLLLLAVLAASAPGCSLVLGRRAPSQVIAPNYPLDCTTTRAFSLLDVACAGAATGWAAAAEAGGRGTSASIAVACGLSALLGYRWTSRCRALTPLNDRCTGGELAACRELTPGWIPPAERWRLAPARTAPASAPGAAPPAGR